MMAVSKYKKTDGGPYVKEARKVIQAGDIGGMKRVFSNNKDFGRNK